MRCRDGLDALRAIGCDAHGGYRRYAWTPEDTLLRAWFTERAQALGLSVRPDRNGNLWAWWGEPGPGAIVTGSHLDSVPSGGAYDGPLGVVAALSAVETLQRRHFRPARPLAVAVFADEEGARFGVSCVGSRLLTGALDPQRARALTDPAGARLEQVITVDPAGIGPDPELLSSLGAFVELHIEQGRGLVDLDAPLGLATGIWPHGRWLLRLRGVPDHAGTTRLADRHDPALAAATAVLAARKQARMHGGVATVGRLSLEPGASNGVPASASVWLDARAPDDATLTALVEGVVAVTAGRAGRDGVELAVSEQSRTPATTFDAGLRGRLDAVLGGVPALPTGAGHDAGILAAAGFPTAMLFVRNPTGVSHSPAEHATDADCDAGADALAGVLAELAG